MNLQAFAWGRLAAHDPAGIEEHVKPVVTELPAERLSTSLEEAIERRVRFLTAYQNAAYAERYRGRVEAVRRLEAERADEGMNKLGVLVDRAVRLPVHRVGARVARQVERDGAPQA